jgi:acyl-CoA synthetase (AMP-forming)/AMP-acid ligase II
MSQPTHQSHGNRLLPSLVDEIGLTDPDRVLYSITKTQDPADGFQDITAAEVARGVNRCAWHIEEHLGRGESFPTLAFIGPQNPIYAILVLACIKTGYKPLLLSPRNTPEASLSLLEQTDCNTILLPPVFPLPVIGELVQKHRMNILEIPALQHWLEDGSDKPYPFDKTFEEARSDPIVVLQTSGSTGMPKPISITHGTFAAIDSYLKVPSLVYPSMCAGSRLYVAFPLCHSAGLTNLLPGCIYAESTMVFGPFPPTSAIINSVHIHGNVQQSAIAPMMLTDLVKNPEYLENLSRIDLIPYGGSPLPTAVGDIISSKTRLFNCMGITECGPLPSLLCDQEDWAYLNFSPVLGSEFRRIADGLYEHFIIRDPKSTRYQAIFETFPELNEWPMRDLYSKHPTKKDHWLYRGRADDIIVFASAQNLNPIPVEETVATSPAVSAALLIGTGRSQSSLLVEAVTPPTNDTEREQLLADIWESVEDANNSIPTGSLKVRRDMVIFTTIEKPMLRAGKGTVQRKLTMDAYSSEIDALYKAHGDSKLGPYPGFINGQD